MVNLFSSMHSPSEAATHRTHPQQPPPPAPTTNGNAPLSILVPAPHMYAIMFPFSTTAAGAATFAAAVANNNSNQFDYFTPPGFTNANNRYMDGSQLNPTIFLSAETLSPATKGTIFPGHAAVTVNGASQSHAPTQAQVQAHVNAAAAAAVAMANSAAAISTMRKLNATYGVPIAPLQRSLHPELKPKLAVSASMPPILAAAASSSSSATKTLASSARLASITASSVSSSASASKVTKISITPDISDFKLVQIFHQFCDPAAKLITLPRFHQLLQHHHVKDDSSTHLTSAKAASGGTTNSSGIAKSTAVMPSQETQALFKVLDPTGAGFIDLEKFMNSFQICNRCTEAKRRAHTAHCASQGQSFVSTALERQLMEDVAPVIVRVVPTSYEGSKVKSCEHYQWTWCEGFEKTGNEKCRGTNRHDKCPKYLANCTLWKHKLPPKNRKAKVFENQDSPSKKFKHFA
uniref:EF-hand domain-containing protein n=1 Tax=Globisporangium ultimum (strain ATCC 200006 / CBS 805.95 / DAOM BR144) TaxID=431595 RepID=K3X3P9_GLOUD